MTSTPFPPILYIENQSKEDIKLKKLIILIFVSFNLLANEVFTFRFKGGNYQNTSNEIIYRNSVSNEKLSELIWENNSNLIGFGTTIDNGSIFLFNFDIYFAFDDGKGTMVDYDWLDFAIDDWTHRSIHNTKTDIFLGDLNTELTAFEFSEGNITILFGYKYDFISSSTFGGSYTYSSAYDTVDVGDSSASGFRDVNGTIGDNVQGVTYSQYFSVPYIGIGAKYDNSPYIIGSRLMYSNQVRVEAEDIHHLRYLVSSFSTEGSLLALELYLAYEFSNNLFLKGTFEYDKYDLDRAYIIQTFGGASPSFAGYGAGMEEEVMLFTLGIEYQI